MSSNYLNYVFYLKNDENSFLMCILVKLFDCFNSIKQNLLFFHKTAKCMSQRPKTPKNTILPLTIHTKVSETVDQAKTLDVNSPA